MRRFHLLLAALPIVLAACADPSVPSGDPPSPATLSVTVAPYSEGPVYIEGAIRYLHVTGPGTDVKQPLDADGPTSIALPDGGSYQLESWARPCDGNCGYLDGPVDRCTDTLAIDGGSTTTIEITAPAGKACSFGIIAPSAAQ